jgi:hypothetical protein
MLLEKELLRYLKHGNSWVLAFRRACFIGNFEILKWLVQTSKVTAEEAKYGSYALQLACGNGHLKIAQLLHHTFKSRPTRRGCNVALQWTCEGGYFEIARWLIKTFNLTSENVKSGENYAFRWACAKGHLDVAQWLAEKFNLTVEDVRSENNWAFRRDFENGHNDVTNWLTKRFGIRDDTLLQI